MPTKLVDLQILSEADGDGTTTKVDFIDQIIADRATKTRIKKDVGDFLFDTILEAASRQQSTQAGGKYKKKLSPDYKKFKQSQGGSGVPDMELSGRMLDALKVKNTRNGIEVGFFNPTQGAKADGHLNFSGDSSLPERQFMPKTGKKFKKRIDEEIQRIIAEHLDGES